VTRNTPPHSGLLLHAEVFITKVGYISVTLRTLEPGIDVSLVRKLHVLRHVVVFKPLHVTAFVDVVLNESVDPRSHRRPIVSIDLQITLNHASVTLITVCHGRDTGLIAFIRGPTVTVLTFNTGRDVLIVRKWYRLALGCPKTCPHYLSIDCCQDNNEDRG